MRPWIGFVAAFGLGCSEIELREIPKPVDPLIPEIEVTPRLLEFGDVADDGEALREFVVRSTGNGPLEITGMPIEGAGGYVILTPGVDALTLEPDTEATIEVAFTPNRGGVHTAQVIIASNAQNEEEGTVDLTARGTAANLVIDPNPLNMGTQFVGCPLADEVLLRNDGLAPLEITAVTPNPGSEFSMLGRNRLPLTLGPGESTGIDITWLGNLAGTWTADFTVDSNDRRGRQRGEVFVEATHARSATDVFSVPENPPVDILFAVDQSCSMDDQANVLANAFGRFIDQIDAVTQGWQIGVVTLDNACFNNGVLTSNTPNYGNLFRDAVSQGDDNEAYTEKLLQLTSMALGKTGPGQCNANFLRPGALLHVIAVSDEEEQSNKSASTWIQEYQTYTANPNLVKVSTVIDIQRFQGALRGCGDGPGPAKYRDANQLTFGVELDICDAAWGNQVSQLAAASLSNLLNFPLSSQADPNALEVRVDGQPWTSGWHYDAGQNAVIFDTAVSSGTEIEVEYGIRVACGP